MVGTTISHYKVLEKIGQGGMGEVYRAEDTSLKREVAIKVLPQQFTQDPQRLARFEREAQLLASLNHPNIATIHSFEHADDVHFLVLELVPGETLAEKVAKGPLPVEDALEVCRQIAEGVEAAHAKGVIHRDLKPANVKVTPEGKVKILDFGLAKAFGGETPVTDISQSPTLTEGMTRDGVILGTAAYMSPEQAKGKPVDKRADVFAFGCVLYELLAGKKAFAGETITETIAKVLESEPQWEALPKNTPWPIRTLLRRCMEKDPNDRFHHVADVRIEIKEALKESATAPPIGVTSAVQPAKWRRVIPWGVAGLLGAIAAFALWSLWYEVPSESSTVSNFGESRPIVVMMDTPARPYDEEDRDRGLTNADVISDFLADFGVLDLRKESTNPQWNREDVIVSWNPDLIILHFSCFASETVQEAAYEKLGTFLEYIAGSTKSHILMYGRGSQFWSDPDQEEVSVATLPLSSEFLRRYETQFQLSGRITMLGFADPDSASFQDPAVVRRVKLEVKRILELE